MTVQNKSDYKYNSLSILDNVPKSKNLFVDGNLRIDYVLVYKKVNANNNKAAKCRKTFQANLKIRQLVLEEFEHEDSVFIKIHAPNEILKRYCEILKIRMPIKRSIAENLQPRCQRKISNPYCEKIKLIIGHIFNFFWIKTRWLPEVNYRITSEYSQNKRCLFDDENEEMFFSTSDRCMIVNFILEQTVYGDKEYNSGISRLLEMEIYTDAYPPHEGIVSDKHQERGKLLENWAKFKNIFSYQPIDDIKNYFGMKFALYFTWVGFYTYMLVPASFMGILCILYGLFTPENNFLGNEICDENQNIIMCPQCDKFCDYYNITDACMYYKIRYLLDNNATYIFAFFMSVWSALYLKLWKRYSAEITHRWGLTGFSILDEHPRPQYESCLPGTKTNKVTNQKEPVVPFWKVKFPCLIFTYSLVLIWIMLVLIFVCSLVLYSMYMRTSQFLYTHNKYKQIFFIPVTTAILNYVIVNILNCFYGEVAIWLTELEYQRTQIQFDDSVQLKKYLFQFVNYYSPIFYIAFLKGKFIGNPGNYIRILGMRQEECDLGGCLLEISIQVTTFMVCEQLFNNFVEHIWPHLKTFQSSWQEGKKNFCVMLVDLFKGICGIKDEVEPRWLQDIKLNAWETELFDEYLEMVVQYGFVTIFASAFPLAPLLALFNNVFIEMRLDAKKFICYYRRPVAQRVPNIGIWFYIMEFIAKISIITNACIIASTTNLIPILLYKFNNNGETNGFLNHSLSYFNVSYLEQGTSPVNSSFNVQVCRLPEFKDNNFERTFEYWHILVAKLVFVVVYQNFVSFFVTALEWIIPDVPEKLNIKIKKENTFLSEQLLQEFENQVCQRNKNENTEQGYLETSF